MDEKFECKITFTNNESTPAAAAMKFLSDIRNPHADWYIEVRDIKTGKRYTVDTDTGEVE